MIAFWSRSEFGASPLAQTAGPASGPLFLLRHFRRIPTAGFLL
jgi:hypothetical protein